MHRSINLGIVNVQNGTYHDFSEKNLTKGGNLIQALFASMSPVGLFPPASVFGSDYFSGTALSGLDIFDAVNSCSEKGFKDEDIVLDVVLTSAANQLDPAAQSKDLHTIGVIARYGEVAGYY